ncbi:MAG: PEP/pyruvate-binding domain-containing protein [Peptostreptococcaceae bacterium]|nr:PEP/pyruvate-binding domain-containing protein [Peptostreptococcaceae bacterium]
MTKAIHLQKMQSAKIPVPHFQVLHFDDLFRREELQQLIRDFQADDSRDNLAIWSRRFQDFVRAHFVMPPLDLPEKLYAVRSCCNLEDGDFSFAGIFESYLNTPLAQIRERVCDCIASLYTVRALEYILEKKIDLSSLKMDVIVQEMAGGELSGVLFTANPLGILNENVIVVGKGLGEDIVSDKVATTTYYCMEHFYHYDGEEDLLDEDKLQRLLNYGKEIEKILSQEYLDIEFTIADEKIYILQARKITSLDGEIEIYDNSNIVESYPNITLPLSISFAKEVYAGVFTSLARRVLKKPSLVDKNLFIFENMVGDINGRIYYKITNWYRVLHFLPLRSKIIPIWQEMLGVGEKSYPSDVHKLSFIERIQIYCSCIVEFFRVPQNMRMLNDRFEQIQSKFNEEIEHCQNPKELQALYLLIKKELLDIWDITLLNDLYAFVFTGIIKNWRKSDEKHTEFISGIHNIESMKPIAKLVEIASCYSQSGDDETYRRLCEEYIQCYGDRAVEELKLETKTFRSNPELLQQKVEEYLLDLSQLQNIQSNLEIIEENLQNRQKPGFFSKRAVLGIKNREQSRLHRTRIYGFVRRIFLSIADSFVKDDLIEEPRDIFYLRIDEVFERIEHPSSAKHIVSERKKEYANYEQTPAYSRLILTKDARQSLGRRLSQKQISENALHGTPCSPGIAEAEVIVIRNPKEQQNAAGKIIVAQMTDPGWVFLLASAQGILVEKGSLLSHTAIVSRELKIPSIVGVKNATRILKTGDIVRMNGANGEIEILDSKQL